MQEILVSELKPHPQNDYFFDDMTGDKWNEFIASIKSRGVIEPIIATEDMIVVSGHQRLRACKELGIDKVKVEIRHYNNDDEILQELLETNIQQRGTIGGSNIKLGRRIKELERLYGIEHGNNRYTKVDSNNVGLYPHTQEELAKQLGIDNMETLRQAKKLASLPSEIQDLVSDGKISASTASRLIAKLSPEEQEKLVAALPATEKLTQKQVQEYIEKISERDAQIGEQANEIDSLQQQNAQLDRSLKQAKKPQTVTVDNTDYKKISELEERIHRLEKEKQLLETSVRLEKEDAERYQKLRSDIEFLTQKKTDLGRQIADATELAGLTVRAQKFLEEELAPIKFMRCMDNLDVDDLVKDNLLTIISHVETWLTEMNGFLNRSTIISNIVEVE